MIACSLANESGTCDTSGQRPIRKTIDFAHDALVGVHSRPNSASHSCGACLKNRHKEAIQQLDFSAKDKNTHLN
jgi:hypothetical protein